MHAIGIEMKKLVIETAKKREIVDITGLVEEIIVENSGISEGVCHLTTLHTTAALSICNLDPGTDLDILDALEKIVPELDYRHPHNPVHVSDHILSALIKPTISVPFSGGRLVLGRWQSVVFFEFDGPRTREISVVLLESA